MATAGDVVNEDLGRMNPPFGRGAQTYLASVGGPKDSVGAPQPEESFTAVGCRHPDRIRNLETSQSVPEKARPSIAWPLSFDIRSSWLEREPLWVVLDQRLVIPLRRPRHTNSPQAAAGDGRDGRETVPLT